jgi:hypothetical protein
MAVALSAVALSYVSFMVRRENDNAGSVASSHCRPLRLHLELLVESVRPGDDDGTRRDR